VRRSKQAAADIDEDRYNKVIAFPFFFPISPYVFSKKKKKKKK